MDLVRKADEIRQRVTKEQSEKCLAEIQAAIGPILQKYGFVLGTTDDVNPRPPAQIILIPAANRAGSPAKT